MIILSPFARKMRDDRPHPKNYPYWKELIQQIDEEIIQVGVEGEEQLVDDFRKNLPLYELAALVTRAKTWVSVDSFFQHFCWDINKPGIVIFGQSDPKIFGHKENINLLKDKKYLRDRQFWLWEQAEYNTECFVEPKIVLNALKKFKVGIKNSNNEPLSE
jgi:ADP-heptose:LPS heptosyltransferase